mmetsp:Transcript_16742/g.63645  ORF Transcript_16742/g.63645 Transcript_16742/m.63645 type:complete len:147 (-) Transcript_16742:1277-1717(-)
MGNLVAAAKPFLRYQRTGGCFEFSGIDIMPDEDDQPWLLEINRHTQFHTTPPAIYEPMMASFLESFLYPKLEALSTEQAHTSSENSERIPATTSFGGWYECTSLFPDDSSETEYTLDERKLALNTLSWAACKRRWKKSVGDQWCLL